MKNWLRAARNRVRYLRAQLRSIKDEASELIKNYKNHEKAEQVAMSRAVECWKRRSIPDWLFWKTVAAEIESRSKRQARNRSYTQGK